jgi:hypothetical protein
MPRSHSGRPKCLLVWLISRVEGILATLRQIGSRTLTLLAVATRHWALFWCGFLLLSAVGALVGYLYVTQYVNVGNMWWVDSCSSPSPSPASPS